MSNKRVATFSKGIVKKQSIKRLLNIDDFELSPVTSAGIDYVVGWGKKPNTKLAIEFAKKNDLEYFSIEDGFLHSTGQGVTGAESCSLVKDKKGIYYDAGQPSDLEDYIRDSNKENFNDASIARAEVAINRIIQANISKYNNGSLFFDNNKSKKDHVVLVVDQTKGDMSLKYGGVSENSFELLLDAAIEENPESQILIKTHPDVIAGVKKGCLSIPLSNPRIRIISDFINPIVMLKSVDKVYVATSQLGFEALMLGKEVVCFGVPFYAGWGLTDDRANLELPVWKRRNVLRTVPEIFFSAYVLYSRYIHIDTKQECQIEDILDYFELQNNKKLKGGCNYFCVNFSQWKRDHIRVFLQGDVNPLFVNSLNEIDRIGFDENSKVLTWASKPLTQYDALLKKHKCNPWYIEDGFIRSTGLGSDLTVPASLVLDKTGIYYDPTSPSDLEDILSKHMFTEQELLRADKLQKALISNEVSKYNLGKKLEKSQLLSKKEQRIILVPGQVEDDASIHKGCIDIKTNSELLKAVKQDNKDAYIIYKPHPDVVSGNRRGDIPNKILNENCDLVLTDVSVTDCLAVVDEVHTMTSLVGFEGLMRNLQVVCYGIPFYSNWGLTKDKHELERRCRKLKLSELIAGTLIEYPLYINWETKSFTTPEIVLAQLKAQIDKQGGKQTNKVTSFVRFSRKLRNYIKGISKFR